MFELLKKLFNVINSKFIEYVKNIFTKKGLLKNVILISLSIYILLFSTLSLVEMNKFTWVEIIANTSITYCITVIFLCALSYVMIIIFEVPQFLIRDPGKNIFEIIDLCYKKEFYQLDNDVNSFEEHICYFNVENIPNDNYIFDYFTYKLNIIRNKLAITFPITGVLIFQCLKVFLEGAGNILNIDMSILMHNILNNLNLSTEFVNLIILTYFFVVYHFEVDSINSYINKLDLLEKVKIHIEKRQDYVEESQESEQ